VKALKIILHDLQATSLPSREELKPENQESDDGDETWADEEVFQGLKKEEYGFLSEYLDGDDYDDEVDPMEDEDLMADPISDIDMRAHLLTFIRQCAGTDPHEFALIAAKLNEDEAAVVRQVVG